MCGKTRRVIKVVRHAGEAGLKFDDPDYAIRVCDTCDQA
jgi:hypothetical protein